jgi:hypothetical protein
MHLTGGDFPGRFVSVDAAPVRPQPRAPERKPSPPIDPRLAYIRARTNELLALKAKLDPVEKQIRELAAKVRRP